MISAVLLTIWHKHVRIGSLTNRKVWAKYHELSLLDAQATKISMLHAVFAVPFYYFHCTNTQCYWRIQKHSKHANMLGLFCVALSLYLNIESSISQHRLDPKCCLKLSKKAQPCICNSQETISYRQLLLLSGLYTAAEIWRLAQNSSVACLLTSHNQVRLMRASLCSPWYIWMTLSSAILIRERQAWGSHMTQIPLRYITPLLAVITLFDNPPTTRHSLWSQGYRHDIPFFNCDAKE